MELDMKISIQASTANEEYMFKGAYTVNYIVVFGVNCYYNGAMTRLGPYGSREKDQWVVSFGLKSFSVTFMFTTMHDATASTMSP